MDEEDGRVGLSVRVEDKGSILVPRTPVHVHGLLQWCRVYREEFCFFCTHFADNPRHKEYQIDTAPLRYTAALLAKIGTTSPVDTAAPGRVGEVDSVPQRSLSILPL